MPVFPTQKWNRQKKYLPWIHIGKALILSLTGYKLHFSLTAVNHLKKLINISNILYFHFVLLLFQNKSIYGLHAAMQKDTVFLNNDIPFF